MAEIIPINRAAARTPAPRVLPRVRPSVGAVHVVLDGVEHWIAPEDALLLAAEIAAAGAAAFSSEVETKR